jgi:hypothetical protein
LQRLVQHLLLSHRHRPPKELNGCRVGLGSRLGLGESVATDFASVAYASERSISEVDHFAYYRRAALTKPWWSPALLDHGPAGLEPA